MKTLNKSENYAIVQFPRMDVATAEDVLTLLEEIRAEGFRPLHKLEVQYNNCFVCEV